MENYSFQVDFTDVPTIDGWHEFAETCIAAVNAFNAASLGPPMRGHFVCGESGSGVGGLPEQVFGFGHDVEQVLTDISEDLYTSLMVLPNPFAHLAAWVSHLAQITMLDHRGEVVPKVLCHRSLLMIQDRMIQRFVERTGFTARKERG